MKDYVIWDITGNVEKELGERSWLSPWSRRGYETVNEAINKLLELEVEVGPFVWVLQILERSNGTLKRVPLADIAAAIRDDEALGRQIFADLEEIEMTAEEQAEMARELDRLMDEHDRKTIKPRTSTAAEWARLAAKRRK